ncbi:MAG: CBS domain-containing protein [Candidatus Omnitrophica bacterium]|nr:CBS domain-containing protein [Candidatus Omnitrophota bacterium]
MADRIQSPARRLTGKLKATKARDIMTKKVITTRSDKTLADITRIISRERISGLPVLNKKKMIEGIVTTKDLFLVMDMITSGSVIEDDMREAANPSVKFAMSSNVVNIKKTTSLDDIIDIMSTHNIHTLPVVEKKKIVGIVGKRDVLRAFYEAVADLDT